MKRFLRHQIILIAVLISLLGNKNLLAQACPGSQTMVCLKNFVSPTPSTMEMDLTVQNTGTSIIEMAALPAGFVYPIGLIPVGATMTGTIIITPYFSILNPINTTGNVTVQPATRQVRWAHSPIPSVSVPITGPGTSAVEHVFAHITLTLDAPYVWPPSFPCNLVLNYGLPPGYSNTATTIYCNGNPNSSNLSSATAGTLSTCNPPAIILNPPIPCPATAVATNLVNPTCNASNGTADVTLSNPSQTTIGGTYTINGGTPITYNTNPISVTGLSIGLNTIVATATGCGSSAATSFTLTPPPITFNTTSITSCATYLWANNNTTYNASGLYTGATANCVTELLDLTITPLTYNTTTTSSCDSFTWANNNFTYSANGIYTGTTTNCIQELLDLTIIQSTTNTTVDTACLTYTWSINGQIYTSSGTYYDTVGCHTEVLDLTITTNLITNTTVAACDSYTWTVNAQTYSSSGNYTYVNGCNTYNLNLSITTSTTTNFTQTSCDSYTWPINGQIYTSSGSYNLVTACHTDNLNLTIISSTTNATSQTTCDTYTWSVNGQTYTASGNYTFVSGCNTQILNLSILPSSTNTITVSACDSYIWTLNGQTYTSSGVYTNTNNCNTQILNLIITTSTLNTTTANACGSYLWSINGQTYTTSGIYSIVTGCHTEILNVTITPIVNNTATVFTCGSYKWAVNGQTYSSNGAYSVVNGCNTQTLLLILNPTNVTCTQVGPTLTAITTANAYQWLECGSSAIIPGATSQSFTPADNGLYKVVIFNGSCIDTSACYTVSTLAIGNSISNVSIGCYPNPTTGALTISSNDDLLNARIKIVSTTGAIIYTKENVSGKQIDLNINHVANGIYYIEILDHGNVYRMKIIKQ